MTPTRIRTFFDEHYLPGNMVVAVAGDLDHERFAAGLGARSGEAIGRRATPKRCRPTTGSSPSG